MRRFSTNNESVDPRRKSRKNRPTEGAAPQVAQEASHGIRSRTERTFSASVQECGLRLENTPGVSQRARKGNPSYKRRSSLRRSVRMTALALLARLVLFSRGSDFRVFTFSIRQFRLWKNNEMERMVPEKKRNHLSREALGAHLGVVLLAKKNRDDSPYQKENDISCPSVLQFQPRSPNPKRGLTVVQRAQVFWVAALFRTRHRASKQHCSKPSGLMEQTQ